MLLCCSACSMVSGGHGACMPSAAGCLCLCWHPPPAEWARGNSWKLPCRPGSDQGPPPLSSRPPPPAPPRPSRPPAPHPHHHAGERGAPHLAPWQLASSQPGGSALAGIPLDTGGGLDVAAPAPPDAGAGGAAPAATAPFPQPVSLGGALLRAQLTLLAKLLASSSTSQQLQIVEVSARTACAAPRCLPACRALRPRRTGGQPGGNGSGGGARHARPPHLLAMKDACEPSVADACGSHIHAKPGKSSTC